MFVGVWFLLYMGCTESSIQQAEVGTLFHFFFCVVTLSVVCVVMEVCRPLVPGSFDWVGYFPRGTDEEIECVAFHIPV